MKTSNTAVRHFSGPNLSFTNRQFRFVIGASMLLTPLLATPETMQLWSYVLLASIPVLSSAILGWDPVYELMGKSTYVQGEEDIQQRSWALPNLGIMDRAVRSGVGILLIFSLLTMNTLEANIALSLLAIPLIISAIIAWDPFYALFGINSFGSRLDVTAAEPDADEKTLATCYSFPEPAGRTLDYPRAA